MFAVGEGGQAMFHSSDGVAGALDHHIDQRVRYQRLPVLGQIGQALLDCVVDAGGGRLVRRPADARQIGPCVINRQICDAQQMHTRRTRHLRQIHGAELARTNQRDANGFVVCGALLKLLVQAHAAVLVWSIGTSVVTNALAGKPLAQGKSTG